MYLAQLKLPERAGTLGIESEIEKPILSVRE